MVNQGCGIKVKGVLISCLNVRCEISSKFLFTFPVKYKNRPVMKTKFIYPLFLILALYGCSNQENTIISRIEKECRVSTKKVQAGDGENFYLYNLEENNKPFEVFSRTKGIIEKTLNTAPASVSEDKMSPVNRRMYNSYKWETPKMAVRLDYNWGKGTVTKTSYEMKLWIRTK
jgi:hypothetical protein